MTDPVVGAWPTLDCLGVAVRQPSWAEFAAWFTDTVADRDESVTARSVFLANAHTLNLASSNGRFREVLNQADAVLNDGVGLGLYGRLAGAPFAYNFNGTDLIPRLLSRLDRDASVFLFGAAPGRAARAAVVLAERYPHVRVVGTRDGFDTRDAVEAVNAARPDLLLVGMGNPLQEIWIDDHRPDVQASVVIGVGALIDFLSGEVPRAPAVVRGLRLEWAYRLVREPRRLFRRYVVGIPVFLIRTVAYLTTHRGRLRS